MQNISKISVVILVKNAEATIYECLQSLIQFPEIILLDNGSTDRTIDIASTFSQVKIYHHPKFLGFGEMKNLAASYATNDWILSIDADEILQAKAIPEIDAILLNNSTIVALSRLNFYSGKCMKCCGWYPDFVWRIYNKKTTQFNCNLVHEGVILPENAEKHYIKDALKHYAADSIEGIIAKMNKYTSMSAEEKFAKNKKTSIFTAIVKFLHCFNKDYIFRKGFLYGYRGFVIATLNASGTFYRYLKLHELNKKQK